MTKTQDTPDATTHQRDLASTTGTPFRNHHPRPEEGRLMTTPTRKQRRRTKGWRAPSGSVYVGRGSKWGNPYAVTQCGPTHAVVDTRTDGVIYGGRSSTEARRVAVSWYRAWLDGKDDLRAAVRQQLAGRDLLCWCPLPEPGQPDHCHAAILIALANSPES